MILGAVSTIPSSAKLSICFKQASSRLMLDTFSRLPSTGFPRRMIGSVRRLFRYSITFVRVMSDSRIEPKNVASCLHGRLFRSSDWLCFTSSRYRSCHSLNVTPWTLAASKSSFLMFRASYTSALPAGFQIGSQREDSPPPLPIQEPRIIKRRPIPAGRLVLAPVQMLFRCGQIFGSFGVVSPLFSVSWV